MVQNGTIKAGGEIASAQAGAPADIVALGAEAAALDASAALLEQGLLVPAIRPPTVAPGTSRLRVALSAAHTDEQVERLVKSLADLPSPFTLSEARQALGTTRRVAVPLLEYLARRGLTRRDDEGRHALR